MNYCQKKVNRGRDCVIKEKINGRKDGDISDEESM